MNVKNEEVCKINSIEMIFQNHISQSEFALKVQRIGFKSRYFSPFSDKNFNRETAKQWRIEFDKNHENDHGKHQKLK